MSAEIGACGFEAANLIGGAWRSIAGTALRSHNPANPDEIVWCGTPTIDHVDEAVAAARAAQPAWAATPIEARIEALRRFQAIVKEERETLARLIGREMGKVLAEARLEATAVAGKVDITLEDRVMDRVRGFSVGAAAGVEGLCRFRPHGVMAVLGPFNFPAHLPNGHIVPALLLGNTVVFKPSEKTPAVGQMLADLLHRAAFPPGVVNLVQGGADVAARLVAHEDLDGILFTGSWPVGRRIMEANLDRPGRMLALEMGGSNAMVVMPSANLERAVVEAVRASFATTGQRCTCTRRIVAHESVADRFVSTLAKVASTVLVGPFDSQTPVFMGPLVSEASRTAAIEFQADLAKRGGRVVVPACPLDGPGFFLTPGVIEVDRFTRETDREVFAPIVQVSTAKDLDDAIEQANATEFGLASAIFTSERSEFEAFLARSRAGCVNWNAGTAGASSKLPFGGLGKSGNHRPAGAFSVDYCAMPIASMEAMLDAPVPPMPAGIGFDPSN
ncbi:MAG: succinylglutamate-semialdehyde dehydrogenase, partial [Phycisphaerales bacterium]